MSGFSVTVDIKDKDVERGLNHYLDRMEHLAGFHKNVGEHVQRTTDERIAAEEAPDGSKWERLSPVTLEARARRGTGSTIYRETGHFVSTINYQPSDENLRWGSNDVRARIFQEGGEAGRNHAVTLPARPYLGLSSSDERAILEIAEDWVKL